jgi:hypothetical protein
MADVQRAVTRINAEAGHAWRKPADGAVGLTFDVVDATFEPPVDWRYVLRHDIEATLTLRLRPFGRTAEVTYSDNVETALPVLTFTLANVKGDVPALGRLVVDNDTGAAAQLLAEWGLESRYYSADANAGLYFEAEACALMGAASLTTNPISGVAPSGGTAVALLSCPDSVYSPMLSTNAVGGAYRTHKGAFRMIARVALPTTNTGGATIRLAWDSGKEWTSPTVNDPVTIPGGVENTYQLADLGVVDIPDLEALGGTQAWEGRFVVKAEVSGEDVFIDAWWLVPLEATGRAEGLVSTVAPTVVAAWDSFKQLGNPALTGAVAPLGGTWTVLPTGGGPAPDATDYDIVSSSYWARRQAISDTAPRIVTLGTAYYQPVLFRCEVRHFGAQQSVAGIAVRATDMNNYLALILDGPAGVWVLRRRLSGTEVDYLTVNPLVGYTSGDWVLFQIRVMPDGSWAAWLRPDHPSGAELGDPDYEGQNLDLAAGVTNLSSGRVGVFDHNASAVAYERTWRNPLLWVPDSDVAIHPSRSIQFRHDATLRQNADGSAWLPVSRFSGDRFYVPQAGREQRTSRLLVKASRGNYNGVADSGVDDVSARVYLRHRYVITADA